MSVMNNTATLMLLWVFIIISQINFATSSHRHPERDPEKIVESSHHKKHQPQKRYDAENNIPSSQKRRHTIPNIWNSFANKKEQEKFENEEQNLMLSTLVTTQTAPACPTCKSAVVKMSEDELTELRIEFVKNQILKKLRLTERPPKINPHKVPSPIADEINTQQSDLERGTLVNRLDDYYGKTTQKIIFLNRDYTHCRPQEDLAPSKCFKFQMPSDVDFNDIKSAHLWIFKHLNQEDSKNNQTFVIQEINHWDKEKSFKKRNTLAIQSTNSGQDGWIKVDIDWPIKNWFQHHNYQHRIEVICKTCSVSNKDDEVPICWQNERQPFIVIDTYLRAARRFKRSINCDAGITDCCRDHLYINFTDIGWNDWILYPPGYNAYFCRGQCHSTATIALSESYYNMVLRKVMLQRNKNEAKHLELIPCCTATQFSSLQLFYMDSNKTATGKQLPNMVVESCGCM